MGFPASGGIPNPLADRQARKVKELELWKRWKYQGDQMALEELLASLRPLIRKIALGYAGNLPPVLIEAKVKKYAMQALETYQPGMAGISTHITNYAQKVLRDITKLQNLGRLPEASAFKIPSYMNLRANMTEALGRDPTYGELADELKTSIAEVKRLEAGTRKDLVAVEGNWLRPQNAQEREQEVLDHLQYELSGNDQAVFEWTFGLHGRPVLTSAQIAQKLGLPVGQINQAKHRIAGLVKRYYG